MGIFKLEKSFTFEAGHVLTHHDGKCATPHGHSYQLIVSLKATSLQDHGPKKNMVLDFQEIHVVVKEMIDTYLDHQWLNDTLASDSPTAEFIAEWIYNHLAKQLPYLESVKLCETDTASVTYFR